ncbi:MAG: outer membrane protein [Myxococcaceae bacterium]|nr:outer membrane protein [Myxococcaceae bacterium]
MVRRTVAATLALGASLVTSFVTRAAFAEDLAAAETEDTRDHTEYAGFPVIGGSTDVGVQLGGAGTITHVGDRFRPYWWKVDGLASISVKGGPRGTEIVQQSHAMRWDIPGGGAGKVRLMPAAFYDKTINSGYFGLGNASRVIARKNGDIGDRYQYVQEEASTRLNARSPLGGPYSTMYGWQLRYAHPRAYPETKLAIDAETRKPDGSPLIYGVRPLGIATLDAGIIYDTRDDELFPHDGAFHRAAWRLSGATPTSSGVYWAGLDLIYRDFRRLPGSFVVATRIMIDLMEGHVPFYDLSQGQAFDPNDMPGGALGVRGVPRGRYAGLVKVVGNVELRRIHGSFHFLGSKFQVGTTAFVDAGRVWNDYTFTDPADGTGVGIKYGVGGGPFIIWDTAALLCVNVAYSPDASAANPGFPLGIYVQEGLTF